MKDMERFAHFSAKDSIEWSDWENKSHRNCNLAEDYALRKPMQFASQTGYS